jgi:hypothetical protein
MLGVGEGTQWNHLDYLRISSLISYMIQSSILHSFNNVLKIGLILTTKPDFLCFSYENIACNAMGTSRNLPFALGFLNSN